MIVRYADTSALVRAYLVDEPDHSDLHDLLLAGPGATITSELARLEFASALMAAGRAGRLADPSGLLDQFDADCGDAGPIALVRLQPETIIPAARQLLVLHRLRTLDAIHLAIALASRSTLSTEDEFMFVTRDVDQTAAARELELTVG